MGQGTVYLVFVHWSLACTYQAEVEEYYRGAGRRREEERDSRRARRAGKEQEQNSQEILEAQEQNKVEELNKQEVQSRREEQKLLRVLDVGSCYNPFGDVEDWEVMAVDISPANSRLIVMLQSNSIDVHRVGSIPDRRKKPSSFLIFALDVVVVLS